MKLPNKIRMAILITIVLFMCHCQYPVRAGDSQSHDKVGNAKSTKYMIIVTGSELLLGAYPDGHTYFITKSLRPLGLECIGSMIADDERADIEEALSYATDKADLVIVTGGLGPTDNDITRETLSDFTGIALKEQPDVLKEMARRFRVSPDRLRANLRRQTQIPTEGTYTDSKKFSRAC